MKVTKEIAVEFCKRHGIDQNKLSYFHPAHPGSNLHNLIEYKYEEIMEKLQKHFDMQEFYEEIKNKENGEAVIFGKTASSIFKHITSFKALHKLSQMDEKQIDAILNNENKNDGWVKLDHNDKTTWPHLGLYVQICISNERWIYSPAELKEDENYELYWSYPIGQDFNFYSVSYWRYMPKLPEGL